MLKEAFENVAPYITNIREIRKFVYENEGKDMGEIERMLEDRIKNETGTLSTDFRILLNEFRKTINTEM